MKKILLNNCKTSNCVFSGLLCCFGFFTHAQEMIVDVDPDVVIVATSPVFSVDFVNDATVEFAFRVQTMTGDTVLGGQPSTFDGSSAIVECFNGQPSGVTTSGVFNVSNFNEGALIESSNEFGLDTSYSLGINLLIDAGIGIFPYLYGSFLNVSNQFLGVRFTAGSNTHYGWIELSVSEGADTITVHSYGYNATPDEMVDVGEMGGLSSMGENDIQIWKESDCLYITTTSDFIGDEFAIFSMRGEEVHSGCLTDAQTKIYINSLPVGLYCVLIESSTGQINRRIYLH